MVVTMLRTVATQKWVAVAEMGFSPSILKSPGFSHLGN